MGRINAWWFAFNLAKDHPLTGGGFNTFTPRLFQIYAPEPDDFHDAHSIYFEILGEQGFVGLGLFLSLGAITLLTARRVARQARRHKQLAWAGDLASLVQVSLIGYAVGGAFLGLAYFDLYYHLIAIVVVLQAIVSRSLHSIRAEEIKANREAAVAAAAAAGKVSRSSTDRQSIRSWK